MRTKTPTSVLLKAEDVHRLNGIRIATMQGDRLPTMAATIRYALQVAAEKHGVTVPKAPEADSPSTP